MLSKEQDRSAFALKQIQKVKVDKDLANFIVGTPTMILQNGMGQTMAFLLAKADDKKENDKYMFVYRAMLQWTQKGNQEIKTDKAAFLGFISGLDQSRYMALQEDILKMLQWLKRYAKAFQEESKGESV